MKQIIQDIKNGSTILEEIPVPLIKRGHVLIRTHRSLVSLGTEKMLVEFGKSNLIAKARQQPEKVKQVLLSDKQIAINAKIAQFQKNINAIGVTPFNSDSWSA